MIYTLCYGYPVCDDDLETENHIFVHCATAKQIWIDILKWWNLHNLIPSNLFEAITLADRANLTSTLTYLLDGVIQSAIWTLWRNRNEITFKKKRSNKDVILNDVKLHSFNWISSRYSKKFCNWIEWLSLPFYGVKFSTLKVLDLNNVYCDIVESVHGLSERVHY
ncbi:hypothetical protein Tco_0644963 [Tanacetum coccineum]